MSHIAKSRRPLLVRPVTEHFTGDAGLNPQGLVHHGARNASGMDLVLRFFARMALSRFWTFILLLSIAYVLVLLGTGRQYSLGSLINGKQGEALVVAEADSTVHAGTELMQRLRTTGTVQQGDTLYTLSKSGAVVKSVGSQPADGLFATCRNTITDLWLPLIGYLTFFCGLLNLLIDSRAMEKVARFLSPVFHRVFPELRKDHPAYGFMTLNFAANFLGLDSAATPFG
ncbi:MAG: nucleoside recognition domain-containing protein, partial [Flavobacteriales bacterium]